MSIGGEKLQVAEGYARKDRALVYLLEGNAGSAEQQAQRAEDLFKAAHFTEGTAQVNRVWGMILRNQEHCQGAFQPPVERHS